MQVQGPGPSLCLALLLYSKRYTQLRNEHVMGAEKLAMKGVKAFHLCTLPLSALRGPCVHMELDSDYSGTVVFPNFSPSILFGRD